MKVKFSESFSRSFKKLSPEVKRKFEKQSLFLLRDMMHPSLRCKKREELGDIWQARVDDSFRFFFRIIKDTYFIINITKHEK